MFDPTGKATSEHTECPWQERKDSCRGDRKGWLGPRKKSKTMALMSSACLGLVPSGPKQQQTQLAFFVLIELQGSQGSLNDCKSGKCKWLLKACNIKLSHWNWANPGHVCQMSAFGCLAGSLQEVGMGGRGRRQQEDRRMKTASVRLHSGPRWENFGKCNSLRTIWESKNRKPNSSLGRKERERRST